MALRVSVSNKLHITNNSDKDIYVFVTPNKDWLAGDLAFDIAKTIYSGGFNGAKLIESAPKTIKSLSDIYDLFVFLKKLYSMSISKMTKVADVLNANLIDKQYHAMTAFIEKGAIRVAPNDYIMVEKKVIGKTLLSVAKYLPPVQVIKRHIQASKVSKDMSKWVKENDVAKELFSDLSIKDAEETILGLLDIINPSVFMSMFGFVSDQTVMITSSDFEKFTCFNSNSDHSWIVKNHEVVRAEYKSIRREDKESGHHFFAKVKGKLLMPGEYLEPNDAIMVQTVNFEVAPPSPNEITLNNMATNDKSLTVVGRLLQRRVYRTIAAKDMIKPAIESVIHLVQTVGASPYILLYQEDGDLVLYKMSGDSPQSVWSTKTKGKKAWRVYMQDDGNFCVYSEKGVCEWALWNAMPQDKNYENSYIAIDLTSGHLAYYRNGDKKPEFFIKDQTGIDSTQRNELPWLSI